MKKRVVSVILALSVVVAGLAGCGGEKANSDLPNEEKDEQGKDSQKENEKEDEKVTLTVACYNWGPHMGDINELAWTKALEEASGINLEFTEYTGAEADSINMMFIDREYPDITMCIGSDKQMADAIAAGDVVALEDYKEYAPNWFDYFEENDDAKKFATYEDGSIYEFPFVRDEPINTGLRDQWFIQQRWLDELNLKEPTTTDEFYEVLKAFKDNAGTGTIPEKVVPYYIHGVTSHIGGALDLIGSFGLRVSVERYNVTVDDDGKVEFNFANEAIKEPIEYIHKLVEEGLISRDGFTDDTSTFLTKTANADTEIGVFHTALNPNSENITVMGPLDSGNGKEPIMRRQTNAFTHYGFVLYKTCEHPEEAVKLANMIADPEWSIQGLYGMFDDVYMSKNDDGTVTCLSGFPANENFLKSAPHDRVSLLCSAETFENLEYSEGTLSCECIYPRRFMIRL